MSSHRSIPPEQTLARAAPLLAAAGITRVAVLTGLDTLGIPVAAAYRPNSRTVSVHQGKGLTLAAAKASAVMEAIETHHAERADLALRRAAFVDLPGAIDPALLPRLVPGDLSHRRLLWAAAHRLRDGAACWAPWELIVIDLTDDGAPDGVFHMTTNGLASGNTRDEALLHGLCEVIERDAIARWTRATPAEQDQRAINLASIDDGPATGLLHRCTDAGLSVRVWDASCHTSLPVFACLLSGTDEVQPELGFGCHPSRAVALLRAVTEAAQARLTVISGARDDVPAGGYGMRGAGRRQEAAGGWLRVTGARPWRAAPDLAGASTADDLRTVLAALDRAGTPDAVWIDLSRPEFGIPVVRVIVPGLEGPAR